MGVDVLVGRTNCPLCPVAAYSLLGCGRCSAPEAVARVMLAVHPRLLQCLFHLCDKAGQCQRFTICKMTSGPGVGTLD